MNKTKKIIIAFIILFLGYSVAWFGYATYVKNTFVTSLNNSQHKNVKISFDEGVTITGYPFQIGFKLNNFKTSGDYSYVRMQDQMDADMKTAATNVKVDPKTRIRNFEYTIGKLLLFSDFTLKNFTSISKDKDRIVLKEGQDVLLDVSSNSNAVYNVTFANSAFKNQAGDLESFLKNIRGASLVGGESVFNDNKTKKLFVSAGGINVKITNNESKDKNFDLTVSAALKDLILGEAYGDFYAHNFAANLGMKKGDKNTKILDRIMKEYASTLSVAAGKANAAIDFTYQGPINFDDFDNGTVVVDLKKFTYKDTLGDNNISGKIETNLLNKKIDKVDVKASLDGKYSEVFYNEFLKLVDGSVKIYQEESATEATLQDPQLFVNLKSALNNIVPKFHEWGLFGIDIDANFQNNNQSPIIKLNQFDIYTSAYGIMTKLDMQSLPSIKIDSEVKMSNYQKLIDDVFDYVNKCKDAFAIIDQLNGKQNAVSVPLNPQIKDALQSTIGALDNGAAGVKENALLKIKFDQSGLVINQFDMSKLMQMGSSLSALLKTDEASQVPQQPAAGADVVPNAPSQDLQNKAVGVQDAPNSKVLKDIPATQGVLPNATTSTTPNLGNKSNTATDTNPVKQDEKMLQEKTPSPEAKKGLVAPAEQQKPKLPSSPDYKAAPPATAPIVAPQQPSASALDSKPESDSKPSEVKPEIINPVAN